VAALALAGYRSGTHEHAAPPPRLPHTVAVALAHRSDEIADALEAGAASRALNLARGLQRRTIAATNARRVPSLLQEPLQTTVNDLAGRIRCAPPAPQKSGENEPGKGQAQGQEEAWRRKRLTETLAEGRYRIEETLGRGGMAVVYLAHDNDLGRPVAVKLLAESLAVDESLRVRFLREARLAAGLSHPNIVRI
jgi:hypothetical protein